MNTNTNRNKRAIGTFPNRKAAEQTLYELKDSGFAMDQVSVVAQDSGQNETIAGGTDVSDHAENKADDGAKVGALSGGALGGLTGLLVGLGALAIPGVGPIMLAGAVATTLATTAAGGAMGAAAGSLLGALIGMGIPEERAKVYNDRVSAGEYLVMVEGTDAEIAKAKAILNHRGIEEWGIYDVPGTESATVTRRATDAPSADMPNLVTPVLTAPVVDKPEMNQRGTNAPSADMTNLVTPVLTGPVVNKPEVNQRPTNAPSADMADLAPSVVTGPVVNDLDVNQPISSTDAQTVKLYEERQKTGEVTTGNQFEVETDDISVPVEKEHL